MLLTIITVCFNSEKTIKETVRSVAAIKDIDIEYIVIDGGSNDRTLDILTSFSPVIDVLVSEPDKGIYDAMNKGIRLATGNWISFINSDDYYLTDGIELILDVLRGNPQSDIIYGNLVRLKSGTRMPYKISRPGKPSDLRKGMSLYHPSMFARSSLYRSLGSFSLQYKFASDYRFVFQAYQQGRGFAYIDTSVCCFDTSGATGRYIYASWREALRIQLEFGVPRLFAVLNYYSLCARRVLLKLLRTDI